MEVRQRGQSDRSAPVWALRWTSVLDVFSMGDTHVYSTKPRYHWIRKEILRILWVYKAV